MDDLISRQAMLDGIDKLIKIHFDRTVVLYKARKVAEDLPSVQPETNCSEIPNNSDTISRRQAIDAICEHGTGLERRGITVLAVANHKQVTVDLLENLPSIQPERKTGRWLPDNTDYYRTKFICSVCGESEEVPTTGFGYGTMWNYCPLCGAKMEDERKE